MEIPQYIKNQWVRLRIANQALAAAQKESFNVQSSLQGTSDIFLNRYTDLERRCREYYQAYRGVYDERGKIVNEMHSLATKNMALQEEIHKTEAELREAKRRTGELGNLVTKQRIDPVFSGNPRLEANNFGSALRKPSLSDIKEQELDSNFRRFEQKEYAQEFENNLKRMQQQIDCQETQMNSSPDTSGNKREHVPSPVANEDPRANESDVDGDRGTRKQPKRARKGRKLAPKDPGLKVEVEQE